MHLLFALFCALPAGAETGFHFVADADTPAYVQSATSSIFQILVPGGQPKTIDLAQVKDENFVRIAERFSYGRWRPDLRVPAIVWQFKLCRARSLTTCTYLDGLKLSTAFLLREPRLLVATVHGIKPFTEFLQKTYSLGESDLLALELPFSLMDAEGAAVTVSGLKPLAFFNKSGGEGFDVSLFQGLAIGRPGLEFRADATLGSTEEMIAAGFPSKTVTRAALGYKDAVEDVLSWTRGKLTAAGPLSRTELMNYVFKYDLTRPMMNPLFISDHDASGGLSGGAVFNSAGNVIGVLTGGYFGDKPDDPPVVVISANLVQVLADWNAQNQSGR